MLNPIDLDLSSLPSVALADRAKLPATSAIYFAIDAADKIQYIGSLLMSKDERLTNCMNCRFWKQERKSVYGFCRRYPPQVFLSKELPIDPEVLEFNMELPEIRIDYINQHTTFPVTAGDYDWCGEFKRIPRSIAPRTFK